MLTELNINLNMNSKNTYDANMGSILHGFLMENISTEFSKDMHRNQLHSYSQYIIKDGEQLIWTINTLDSDTKNEIVNYSIFFPAIPPSGKSARAEYVGAIF